MELECCILKSKLELLSGQKPWSLYLFYNLFMSFLQRLIQNPVKYLSFNFCLIGQHLLAANCFCKNIVSLSTDLSTSQFKDEFESFADNFELNLDSIAIRKATLDCCSWWLECTNKSMVSLGKITYEGTRIDSIMLQFGLEQLIREPTHITGESFSAEI